MDSAIRRPTCSVGTPDDVIPISKYVAVIKLVSLCILLSSFIGGSIYYVFVSYWTALKVTQQVSYIIYRFVEFGSG